ncbi:MAG: hypothetical protein M1826_002862 [Phylliscum demangeonii]|nr:MAG: hypothetical protein M1826_002862 [Phylliscum demangeonii]
MKRWMVYAVALAHFLAAAGRGSALPQHLSAPGGGGADLAPGSVQDHSKDNDNNKNDRGHGNGVHDSNSDRVTGALVGVAALGGARLAWQARTSPQRAESGMDQPLPPRPGDATAPSSDRPQIMLSSNRGEPVRPWTVPAAMAEDAVWMECVYGYLSVPRGTVVYLSPWRLADAISDCAHHHGRHLDRAWFDAMHEHGQARIACSGKRATAWARDQGQGDQVRDAAPSRIGHFRDRAEMTTTATPPPPQQQQQQQKRRFSISVPHWANRLRADLHRLLLAAPLHRPAYHQPSSARARLENLPLVEREAAAGGF